MNSSSASANAGKNNNDMNADTSPINIRARGARIDLEQLTALTKVSTIREQKQQRGESNSSKDMVYDGERLSRHIHISYKKSAPKNIAEPQKAASTAKKKDTAPAKNISNTSQVATQDKKESRKVIWEQRNETRKSIYVALSHPGNVVASGTTVSRKKRFSRQAFTETLKFLATSAAVFMVTMGVLNFSAYKQIVANVLNPGIIASKQQELREVTEAKPKFNRPQLLPVAGIERQIEQDFPAFMGVLPNDNRIVIEKIGKNVPIVENVGMDALVAENWVELENSIQVGLRDGVVRYPGTARPGQEGNVFITGHSSYYAWDQGRYKDVFALLETLEVGDTYTVYYDQKKYVYKIYEEKLVKPNDTSVLAQPSDRQISTLMTCWPTGTTLWRKIFVAERIE